MINQNTFYYPLIGEKYVFSGSQVLAIESQAQLMSHTVVQTAGSIPGPD